MKILMISNHLGVQSGVQRYVQNLLLHLDTAKYRVTLFVGQCPPDQASTAPALEAHGVEILAVPDNKKDRIRALAACPILFLTAKTEEADVLTGLGLGGDDYLSKPFRIAELRARVAAHLRRESRAPRSRIRRRSFSASGRQIRSRAPKTLKSELPSHTPINSGSRTSQTPPDMPRSTATAR